MSNTTDVASLLASGLEHHRSNRLDSAKRLYQQVLDIEPENADALNLLGAIASQVGDDTRAITLLRRAVTQRTGFAEAHNNLGVALKQAGQLDQAISSYQKALVLKPDYVDACNNLGGALTETGRAQAALPYLRKALALSNNHIRCRYNYGKAISRVVPLWQFGMMNDGNRNDAYLQAIERAVRPDMHVLEIGTGGGLLAMMAARAGARAVTTCEMVPEIAETARAIIARNGYADRISVITKKSTEIKLGTHLRERGGLLVTEIFSNECVGEGALSAVADARRRLIEPDAQIIPCAARVMAALVGGTALAQLVSVAAISGFDLSPFNDLAAVQVPLQMDTTRLEFLSDEIEVLAYDFSVEEGFAKSSILDVPVTQAGTCFGLVQWIRIDLDPRTTFENHPLRNEGASGWQIVLNRFPDPLTLAPGNVVRIRVEQSQQVLYFDLLRNG